MIFAELNWLAVAVAALAQFTIGGIWFGPKTFYPIWMKAMGKEIPTEQTATIGGVSAGVAFGLTFVGQLIQVITLAVFIELATKVDPSFGALGGLAAGSLLGFGVAAASSLSHRLFANAGLKVWIIEVAQDIVSLAVGGLILGAWL
jgi:Protein of unknown function (DUF1761)